MPVSIAVLTVAATAVPALARPPKPVIDYGIPGHRCGHDRFDHGHKLGGTTYAWGSATIVGLLIGAWWRGFLLVMAGGAAPLRPSAARVFGSPVFTRVRPVLRGQFAMLGALTFVPIYLGYVDGASATARQVCARCRW